MIKNILKSLIVISLIALIAGVFFNPVSANEQSTENKEMPTLLQVKAWNTNFGTPENYVEASYKDYIETFPKGHVDKLKDGKEVVGIVFYYYDPSASKGYGTLYYDKSGKKMSPGCGNGLTFFDSYKGVSSSETKEVKEKTITEESEDDNESDEEEVSEEDSGTTYDDLLDVLEEDNTNEKSFTSSKKCAKTLIENLPEKFQKNAKLVKATFKATGSSGKHLIRYCAGIETSDKGFVYIDSYSGKDGKGIDKQVTVLKAGQRWQAESACKTCTADSSGRYNRGKVLKVTVIE